MRAAIVVYLILAPALAVHNYLAPLAAGDLLDYAACVWAIKTTDPVQIHEIAYREILQGAPPMVIPHMLGTDENTQQAAVRRDRRANPYHFVEFLPYFSIKPLYIEPIYGISRLAPGCFAPSRWPR
jgi:hypothetical protein